MLGMCNFLWREDDWAHEFCNSFMYFEGETFSGVQQTARRHSFTRTSCLLEEVTQKSD